MTQDRIDELLREIEELRDALKGRTVSCSFCNQTSKERDELRSAVRKFVFEESKFAAKSFCSTIISYGDERPRAWRTALRAMERML